MKFVCTGCDEPMQLVQGGDVDEEGSLSVTFRCPRCSWRVTLLTNPQETQLVRSLGVKIGGRTLPPQPMGMTRTHLADTKEVERGSPPASMPAQETAAAAQRIYWSAEAEERLNRIPRFVRPMVRQRIEAFARQKGYGEITPRVMDEAREIMGM